MCHTPGPNTQSECAVLLLQGWGKTTPFSRKRRSQQLTRWFGPKLNTPSVPPREHVTHGVFRSMAMSGTLDTRNTWRCGSTACWIMCGPWCEARSMPWKRCVFRAGDHSDPAYMKHPFVSQDRSWASSGHSFQNQRRHGCPPFRIFKSTAAFYLVFA